MNERRLPPVPVRVSDHAKLRARERFPEMKLARIVDEVRVAYLDGRFSVDPPPGWVGVRYHECLYCWTLDGERLYAIGMSDPYAMIVATCVKAEL